MINYDDTRRDITIETSPGPRTQSRLIIREPQIADSGNYTCSASNTEPASIYVFVSNGNFPSSDITHDELEEVFCQRQILIEYFVWAGDNTAAISGRTSAANRIDIIVMGNLLTLSGVLFALIVTWKAL